MEYNNDYIILKTDYYFNKRVICNNLYGNIYFWNIIHCIFTKEMINYKYFESFKKESTVTGLANLRGVCYMNALLQYFYYCFPETNYFLKLDEYQKSKLGLVSEGYYTFVKGLNLGDIYAG